MNTVIPGLDPWSKVIADPRIWHFAFHKVRALPELLITGHERAYFDFFYDMMAGDPARLTSSARDAYARGYSSRDALTAGLDWYRAFDADAAHNSIAKPIKTPILYLRGDADGRRPEEYVAGLKAGGATNVQTAVLPGSGEYAPEEAPDALISAIRGFKRDCTLSSEHGRERT
jgi:pimeloyl-ACP methyl ester carboxylesterase